MQKSIFYPLLISILATAVFGQNSGNVSGKVTNADGKPVINATVYLEGTTRTNATGGFALEAVEAGEYNLIVTNNEYALQSAAVTIGSETSAVNITLQTLAETVNRRAHQRISHGRRDRGDEDSDPPY